MSETRKGVEPYRQDREVARPFSLMRDLFKFAKQHGIAEGSLGRYWGYEENAGQEPVELPEKFKQLIDDSTGNYFVVGLEDRRSLYNQEGTHSCHVKLSTAPKQSANNDRVREIDLIELDPSMGNKAEIKITDSVNNQSREQLNTAADDEAEQPHGETSITHELSPTGEKKVKRFETSRLDEGVFELDGQKKAVRWNRSVRGEIDESDQQSIEYGDSYIIGRSSEIANEERVDVRTKIVGSLDAPESIVIEIGIGSIDSANVLYEDLDRNIKIVEHEPLRAYRRQMEVLGQDPSYAFIFDKPINADRLTEMIRLKISMLQDEWDKPSNVFGGNVLEDSGGKQARQIESGLE